MADPIAELWLLPLSDDEKCQLAMKLGMMKLENKDPSVFFSAPTPELKARVLRNVLQDSNSARNEDVKDLTYKTVHDGCSPAVPSLEDLPSFLVAPPNVKLRVSRKTYRQVSDYDLHGFFEPSDGDYCYTLEHYLLRCVFQPDAGVSEFSFIQTWDNMINTPLKQFLNVPFKKERDTNLNTGTGSCMPDVVGYVGACYSLWLAEENQEETGDPEEMETGDPVYKRKWCYKRIPYILGYFARGLSVTLIALYHEEGKVKSKNLASFNLGGVGDRIRLFTVLWNVGRVLAGLHDICTANNEGSEFEVVKTILSGKSVRLAGSEVIKGYRTKAKRMAVWKIYAGLKSCPNMEACLSRRPSEEDAHPNKKRKVSEYTLRFSPRLNRHARARTQSMLVKALLDVSRALAWLHTNKLIHRDVRWANVALNDATEVWTLIDADEACTFEEAQKAGYDLCEQSHAPEMRQGPHDSAVDVWGLGHLIKTAKNVRVSSVEVEELLQELAGECLAESPADRPTIGECRRRLTLVQELLAK